jgi:hypothetical protein
MNSSDIFANLIVAYPTFEALTAYLDSIGVQSNTKEGDALVIFRYNREKADLTNPLVRAFRSVIWDSRVNRPVFVAPTKSEPLTTLPTDYTQVLVEDFLDGVMVNLFVDPVTSKWRLSTRSRLDADNKFYEHTFGSLFLSTWQAQYGTDFSVLNPSVGYSFVLQHPKNRIVVPVAMPSVTCVEISAINPATCTVTFMPAVPGSINVPRRYAVTSQQQLGELVAHLNQFEGIRSQGVTIKEVSTGKRWKVRTEAYKQVRTLRGNHSRMEYVWFDNMKKGLLPTYLAVYPEEVIAAQAALKNWTDIVADIYNWYVHVFKVRDVTKDKIPAHYKGVLFDLHSEYVKRLAPAKLSLTWVEHQALMAKQDLKRIVFLATFKAGAPLPPSAQKTAAARAESKAPASNVKTWASVAKAAVPGQMAAVPAQMAAE